MHAHIYSPNKYFKGLLCANHGDKRQKKVNINKEEFRSLPLRWHSMWVGQKCHAIPVSRREWAAVKLYKMSIYIYFSNILHKTLYNFCPEVTQSCNMKNRDIYWRRYKIQETLYIGQWGLSPLQSRHIGTSHSSPKCHKLPHHIFLNLIDSLKSLPFQRWF